MIETPSDVVIDKEEEYYYGEEYDYEEDKGAIVGNMIGSISYIPSFKDANMMLKKALEFDEIGDDDNALEQYTIASHLLMDVLKVELDEYKKDAIRYELFEVFNRVEEIKNGKKDRNEEMIDIDDEESLRKLYTDYEVIARIDKIRCYRTRGSVGIRETLSDGTYPLLILKKSNMVIVQIGPYFSYQFKESVPCLKMGRGFYVLPGEEVYYSIVFPRTAPDTFIELFESTITPYCTFKSATNEVPDDIIKTIEEETINEEEVEDLTEEFSGELKTGLISKGITKTIERGGSIISSTIRIGGCLITRGIQFGESFISSRISNPNEKHVGDKVKDGIKKFKDVSGSSVKISDRLLSRIGDATYHVGTKIGKTLKKNALKSSKENRTLTNGVLSIGEASLTAFLSIWGELEIAGWNILDQTGNTTTNLLEKKNMETK